MSFEFSGNDNFRCDLGAGNVIGYPVVLAAFIKYADHPAATQTVINLGNSESSINDSIRGGISSTDGGFSLVSQASGGGQTLDTYTLGDPTSLDGVWFPVVYYFRSDNNREVVVAGNSDGANTGTRAVTEALRYLIVGENLAGAADLNGVKVAEVALWNSNLSGTDRALYEGGLSAKFIDNANLVAYYSYSTSDSTPDDESGNGGPSCVASGTPTFDSDHPIIDTGSAGRIASIFGIGNFNSLIIAR